jgi:hypothetical protein
MTDKLTGFLTALVVALWLAVMAYGCRKTLKDMMEGKEARSIMQMN